MFLREYITTPIYYVNDVPHLGSAYTTLAADAFRRYAALRGREARMLTGTDEHGLKIAQAAQEKGLAPEVFVETMSQAFREAWPKLHAEPSDFLRTTEARHKEFAQDFWKRVEASGDLYEGVYEDWYCVACESFKTEKELATGALCPVHASPVQKIQEQTVFFRLSRWQDALLKLYATKPSFLAPASRRNEVLRFVEEGLRDLSVSRTSFSWGVPVPGKPGHVMYVWFDALTNYLSALGPKGSELSRFWAPQAKVTHLVGKDIVRFHAVYWPAMLLSAGYSVEELPYQVFAHGFLTINGQKMSKTLRNTVDPIRLAGVIGADALRYNLLRSIAFGQDGDFSFHELVERTRADLSNNLGNLLHRVLGLTTRWTGGRTPTLGPLEEKDNALLAKLEAVSAMAAEAWEDMAPHRALEITWSLCSSANQYVDHTAPWACANRGERSRVNTILGVLLEVLRGLSVLIAPVLPRTSDVLRTQLGLSALSFVVEQDQWPLCAFPRAAGEILAPSSPLFPSMEEDILPALRSQFSSFFTMSAPPVSPPSEPAMDSSVPTCSSATNTLLPPIDYDLFARMDIRLGVVLTCARIPKKDKLLLLTVDLGEPAPRTIVSGIALSFSPEEVIGMRVLVVANLAPRDFGKGLVSHGMLLAAGPSTSLRLATLGEGLPLGTRVT